MSQKSHRTAPKSYTESWLRDYIRDYINKNQDLRDVLYSFRAYPNGIFLINPTRDPTLLDCFVDDSHKFQHELKQAVIQFFTSCSGESMEKTVIKFRNFKVKITEGVKIKMSSWGPHLQNTPISTECVVVSMGKEQTYTKKANAKCLSCGHFSELFINPFTHEMQHPPNCGNENCHDYKKEMFVDEQSFETGPYKSITIQEPMEEAKHGSPVVYQCEIKDEAVRETFIGQRKKLVGTFTSYIDPKGVNDILIKAISVNDATDEGIAIASDDDILKFKEWVKEPDFLPGLFARSFSPEIYNETLAKICVGIGCAGGLKKGRLRGDINVLLIGDPSTGKSKILDYIPRVIVKSAFINCATASGAGITIAYDDKIKAPRIGVIPMCHLGVAALDELGKLRKEDLKYTQESMEEGRIHYDKGGFDMMTPAETTIIAGANPKHDYYDSDFSIVDNINLTGPVISRFDIKLNILMDRNPNTVAAKIKHIDEFREIGETAFVEKHDLIPTSMLLKYFTYIRKLKPEMTKEASNMRREFYLEILELQQKRGSLPIDTRFYEGLYRMSTAVARMHLAKFVTEKHMKIAIDIQKEALETFYMNIAKGDSTFNLQIDATNKEGAFKHAVKECQAKAQEEFVEDDKIIEEMCSRYKNFFASEDQAWSYFEKMEINKIILKKKGKYYLGTA